MATGYLRALLVHNCSVRMDAHFGGMSFIGVKQTIQWRSAYGGSRILHLTSRLRPFCPRQSLAIRQPMLRPISVRKCLQRVRLPSTEKYPRSPTTQHEHSTIAIRARKLLPSSCKEIGNERKKPECIDVHPDRTQWMRLYNSWQWRPAPCSERKRSERGANEGRCGGAHSPHPSIPDYLAYVRIATVGGTRQKAQIARSVTVGIVHQLTQTRTRECGKGMHDNVLHAQRKPAAQARYAPDRDGPCTYMRPPGSREHEDRKWHSTMQSAAARGTRVLHDKRRSRVKREGGEGGGGKEERRRQRRRTCATCTRLRSKKGGAPPALGLCELDDGEKRGIICRENAPRMAPDSEWRVSAPPIGAVWGCHQTRMPPRTTGTTARALNMSLRRGSSQKAELTVPSTSTAASITWEVESAALKPYVQQPEERGNCAGGISYQQILNRCHHNSYFSSILDREILGIPTPVGLRARQANAKQGVHGNRTRCIEFHPPLSMAASAPVLLGNHLDSSSG
ncbi:hypothetical protein B0H19DRAFT_1080986 [Mycena capillaripes]|nr:hypothetical protein B0H19DRAFT_1080986 [Mycena capillaripes]